MSFLFARYGAIFCGVAFLVALCTDVTRFLFFMLVASLSRSNFAFGATRRGWIAIFAMWWLISFLIALPLARKFNGLPFSLL